MIIQQFLINRRNFLEVQKESIVSFLRTELTDEGFSHILNFR